MLIAWTRIRCDRILWKSTVVADVEVEEETRHRGLLPFMRDLFRPLTRPGSKTSLAVRNKSTGKVEILISISSHIHAHSDLEPVKETEQGERIGHKCSI